MERGKIHDKEIELTKLTHKSKDEQNNLNAKIEELNNNVLCLETTVKSKNILLKDLVRSYTFRRIDLLF